MDAYTRYRMNTLLFTNLRLSSSYIIIMLFICKQPILTSSSKSHPNGDFPWNQHFSKSLLLNIIKLLFLINAKVYHRILTHNTPDLAAYYPFIYSKYNSLYLGVIGRSTLVIWSIKCTTLVEQWCQTVTWLFCFSRKYKIISIITGVWRTW